MFRVCLLAVALAASAHALACSDFQQGPQGPVSRAEFTEAVAAFKAHFLDAATQGETVTQAVAAANAALANGDFKPWSQIGQTPAEASAFQSMSRFFQEGEAKVWNMAHRLYNSGGVFDYYGNCSNMANMVESLKEQIKVTGNVTEQQIYHATKAFEQDLVCLTDLLAGATALPDVAQFGQLTQEHAFDLLLETFKQMFHFKHAYVRWYSAGQQFLTALRTL